MDNSTDNKHICIRNAGVTKNNNDYIFDFVNDTSGDIIHLATKSITKTRFKNNIYWFGYEFEQGVSSQERKEFIDYIKGIGTKKIPEHDLRHFIEFSLIRNKVFDAYDIDCVVSPRSNRSELVQKILEVLNGTLMHFTNGCSYELIKTAPLEIEFDFERFEDEYGDNPNYGQMLVHVHNDIMPKIKNLEYFSLAKNVKPKYRPFITNYLGFPNVDELKKFQKMKGRNILIVDDINTSGSTLSEILRVLNKVNRNCNMFIYTLIGKQ